ncbi:hypothetical protein [Kitasatospora sp. LaBMicrA B282]|uniref:hypothetical protein n=1 Tax=Kitasatospora sp. LaBMicrA B282 TaxID=3420949 RepID=UPI003D09A888
MTTTTEDRRTATVDAPGPLDGLPRTARFESEPALRFLDQALLEYRRCLESRDADGVPHHLPRASGLLFGQVDDTGITIADVEFVPNVRDSDEGVIAEFETTIAPRFGEVYRNPGRGFWSDEIGVLRAIQRQAANGRELLGSIHSHPNWHRIGPPHERFQRLSENPTQMDAYLFGQSCWPVNVIWYVHTDDAGLAHRVAGWRPGPAGCERLDIRIPAEICAEHRVALPSE